MATTSKGRGVLRLILLRQHVNLLSAPALFLQLISILYPSIKTSAIICLAFEFLTFIVASSGNITNLAISLGRYFQQNFIEDCKSIDKDIYIFQALLSLPRHLANLHQRRELFLMPHVALPRIVWNGYIHTGGREFVVG